MNTYAGRPRARSVHGQQAPRCRRIADRRRFIGLRPDPGYVELAMARVEDEGHPPLTDPDRLAGSKDRIAQVLSDAGFESEGGNVRVKGSGMSVNDVATDATGGRWVIELGGPFVSHRGGLTTADAVWRTLGRAHLRGLDERVLVLTSELPKRRSEFDHALRAAGPQALFDVIDVFDEDALERLQSYASGDKTQLPGFWNPTDLT